MCKAGPQAEQQCQMAWQDEQRCQMAWQAAQRCQMRPADHVMGSAVAPFVVAALLERSLSGLVS